MKVGTIPFPREFGPGAKGIDCKAVKRALAVALGGSQGMSLTALTFAKPAQQALVKFKTKHGLLNDPIYTLEAHQALRPSFDLYGASLMARLTNRLAATRQRDAFVAGWRWAILHHALNDYSETRPIPEGLPPFETTVRIKTDCSGETEILAGWENLPDPSGLAFNGQGNTGSLLLHGTWVTQKQAQHADLVVYRAGTWDHYGHHVATILEVLNGGADFQIGSNGHQDDPGEYLHSAMLATQAGMGYPLPTFVRWLPPIV